MLQTHDGKTLGTRPAASARGPNRFRPGLDAAPPTAFSSPLPPPPILAVCALVAFGSLALLPVWSAAWALWSSDPLRSIGAFFPPLSMLGLIAAWRRIGWTTTSSRWGLPLLLFGIASASLFSAPMLLLFFFGARVRILHPGMALFAYGAGAALWFGGTRLFRAALLPLCLLLLIDPVPHWFNSLLDLPLQMLSANTARAFAHLIGLQPTGVQLQMMFTPTFGMFIVPGCNGVRGAVTFAYLALIFGYIKHLPARALALFTVCALFAGYAFNLLRLCVLVLYYRAGLGYPSIRPYGTQADYLIGVTLFLTATLGTGFAITWYVHRHGLDRSATPPPAADTKAPTLHPPILRRAAVLAVLALAFFLPQAHSIASSFHRPLTAADALAAYPTQVGPYTLTRTWEERDGQGALMFVFGDYQRAITGEHLEFGIYLASEDHYVFLSKLTQGIKPAAQSSLDALTHAGRPAHFVTSLYRDSTGLTLDAESSCRKGLCEGNVAGQGNRFGMLRPHLADLFVAPDTRRVPIILRQSWPTTAPTPDPQQQFQANVREFMSNLNLAPLLARAN